MCDPHDENHHGKSTIDIYPPCSLRPWNKEWPLLFSFHCLYLLWVTAEAESNTAILLLYSVRIKDCAVSQNRPLKDIKHGVAESVQGPLPQASHLLCSMSPPCSAMFRLENLRVWLFFLLNSCECGETLPQHLALWLGEWRIWIVDC